MTSRRIEELMARKANDFTANGRGKHKYAFLALWKEIRRAVHMGYNAMVIWKVLHHNGLIRFSYPWFARLLHEQLAKERKDAEAGREQNNSHKKGITSLFAPVKGELPKEFGQVRDEVTLDEIFGTKDKTEKQ